MCVIFFFFNDTATTEIYTLSLHDALPISARAELRPGGARTAAGPRAGTGHRTHGHRGRPGHRRARGRLDRGHQGRVRSEEHTSELQSRQYLVCRLLLEKKKKKIEYLHLLQ